MGGHESDTDDAVDFIYGMDQVCKIMSCRISVRIDILAQQHDFLNAVSRQTFDLSYDLAHHSALFASACVRNYAVCAEIVASVCDVDESLMLVHALWLHLVLIDHRIVVDDASLLSACADPLFKQMRELSYILCAEYYVDPGELFVDLLNYPRLLRHASTHAKNEIRILRPDFLELTEYSEESLVSILADAACVDDNNVRLICIFFMFIAHGFQNAGDVL